MVAIATGESHVSSRSERSAQLNQHPRCIWFTGLPAAGKTTLARTLEQRLRGEGHHTYVLDGDHLRRGLNNDLGFNEAHRIENVRRVAEVAQLMVDAGLIVLVAVVSPFRAGRQIARALFAEGEFVEVFLDTPLEECERRDPKGMYASARRGDLRDLTGIDSPYEPPINPDLRIDTSVIRIDACVGYLYQSLFDFRST